MYKTLLVEAFRGLRSIQMDGLGQINLISGANNTGKSAILEAIFLLASGPLAGRSAITVLRPLRGLPNLPINTGQGAGPWDALFPNLDTSSIIRIQGTAPSRQYSISMAIPEGMRPNADATRITVGDAQAFEVWKRSVLIMEQRGSGSTVKRFTESITARSSSNRTLVGLPSQVDVSFDTSPPTVTPASPGFYLSSKSRSTPEQLAERFSRLRMRSQTASLVEAMRLVEPMTRGVEILIHEGRQILHVDRGNGPPLPLTVFGEGTAALAEYILIFEDAANGVLLIDEIDNGLHWSVLPSLWAAIVSLARQYNVQVFATTHSKECLVAAHKSVLEEPASLRLYRLWRDNDSGDVEVIPYDDDLLAGALEMDLDLR